MKATKKMVNIPGFTLTPKQEGYYEAVEWLTNNLQYQAEGRTILLAKVYIDHAYNNPGSVIYFADHYLPSMEIHKMNIETTICVLIEMLPSKPEKLELQDEETVYREDFKVEEDNIQYSMKK